MCVYIQEAIYSVCVCGIREEKLLQFKGIFDFAWPNMIIFDGRMSSFTCTFMNVMEQPSLHSTVS